MYLYIGLGLILVVCIIVVVLMFSKMDKLEATLIKHGSKESFEGRVSEFNNDNKELYNEFWTLVPEKYKSNVSCEDPTKRTIQCLLAKIVRDNAVDFDTLVTMLFLLTWMSEGMESIVYDKSNRVVTILRGSEQFVRDNGGNNKIPYDKFKSIFANMVDAMKAKVANYNAECNCNADSW